MFFCLFFPGKAGKQFCVRLFPCLTEGTFKPQRFSPEKNNVRHHWFSGQESSEDPTGTLLGLWVVCILEGTMQVCWDCGHKGHWYNIFCVCCSSFVIKEDHVEWVVSCLSFGVGSSVINKTCVPGWTPVKCLCVWRMDWFCYCFHSASSTHWGPSVESQQCATIKLNDRIHKLNSNFWSYEHNLS